MSYSIGNLGYDEQVFESYDEMDFGDGRYAPPPEEGFASTMGKPPKWAIIAFSSFLVVFVLELMLITALAWYRIGFGLYHQDTELFVMALNEFGASFFGGAVLGAGGAVAAMRIVPTLLASMGSRRSQENI